MPILYYPLCELCVVFFFVSFVFRLFCTTKNTKFKTRLIYTDSHFCFIIVPVTMKRKKQKTKWWLIPVIIFLILSMYIAGMYWWQQHEEEKARFAMYPGYGIQLPLGYQVHGIDISFYQQLVYWPSVKKMSEKDVKIGFVFIKATEGLSNTDKQFKRNWLLAKESGISRGAYHFFIATKDGAMQAKNFIKNVKLEPGDLPPVLDIEQLYGVPPTLMRQRITTWLQMVEAAYHVKPIIYSNADFYNRNLGDAFNKYPLWVAHYFENNQPRVSRDWVFWQHSSGGKVNGITSFVDFNVFNGDSAAFNELLIK